MPSVTGTLVHRGLTAESLNGLALAALPFLTYYIEGAAIGIGGLNLPIPTPARPGIRIHSEALNVAVEASGTSRVHARDPQPVGGTRNGRII